MLCKLTSRTIRIYLALVATSLFAGNPTPPTIIPLPQKLELHDGVFQIQPGQSVSGVRDGTETKILVEPASEGTGRYLAEQLRKSTGMGFRVLRDADAVVAKGQIRLTSKDARPDMGEEGYTLSVTPEAVVIRAHGSAGMFYGVQTLLQLLPPQVASSPPVGGVRAQIPCVEIQDQPRFK